MRTKTVTTISLAVLSVLTSIPVFGQDEGSRPSHWPDAATVVREYLAGKETLATSVALQRCPRENPYGDTVIVALLSASLPPSRAARLSAPLTLFFLNCGDPRVEAWFRDHLLSSTTYMGAVAFFDPFVTRRSREDIELLKEIAFDDSREEELRSQLLQRLSAHMTRAEQADLLLELFSRTDRIPEPFSHRTFRALVRSPVGDRFVEQAFRIVEEQPHRPNAGRLLGWLVYDTEVRTRRAWRGRLRSTLVRIENDRSGRFPPGLIERARALLEILDANP